jgi:hypothetical protein
MMNSEISFKIHCWDKYLTNIFLLGLILMSFKTFGQTYYYVDKLSGNDENNGTSTNSA